MGITQGTVKGGASDADHHGDQTKQEEKQAGVTTPDFYRRKEGETGSWRENYKVDWIKNTYWKLLEFSLEYFHNGQHKFCIIYQH